MKLLIRRFSSALGILVSLNVRVVFRYKTSGSRLKYCLVLSFWEQARKALNMPRGHICTSDLNVTQWLMHWDVFELWELVNGSMES
jgi:hypothetical protein